MTDRTVARMGAVVLAATMLAALAGGCGGGNGPADEIEFEAFGFTTILDDASLVLLTGVSADGMTLTFTGSTPQLDAIEADRVLVGGPIKTAPLGFLRRVDEVTRNGDLTVVETSPTAIVFAFRKLKVHVRRDLAPASVQGSLSTALTDDVEASVAGAVTGSKDFHYDLDWPAFDGDGDSATTEDRVLVQGDLDATASVSFDIDFEWPDVEDSLKSLLKLDINDVLDDIGFQLDFSTSLSAGASLHVEGKAARSFEREIPLGPPVYLPPIWVPPVLFTPRLEATAGIRGGASGEVALDLSQSGTMSAGVSVSITNVQPHLPGPTFEPGSAQAQVNATAFAEAYVTPRIEVLVYDLAGPYAGIRPWMKVDADVDRDPCWRLTGGMDAVVGVFVHVAGIPLADGSWDKTLAEKEFLSGTCPPPPGGDPLDPLFEPWSAAYDGVLGGIGTGETASRMSLAHDGSLLLASGTARGLMKFAPGGQPVWARQWLYEEGGLKLPITPAAAEPLLDTGILVAGDGGYVLKTDAAGVLESASRLDFATGGKTRIGDAEATLEGGVLLVGDSPDGSGGRDGWMARFGPAGELEWARSVAGPMDERPTAAMPLPDGGAVVSGYAFQGGEYRSWAVRVGPGSDGAVQWFVRIVDCAPDPVVGEKDVMLRTGLLTGDGDFVLGGRTFYPGYQSLLLKMKPDGTVPWSSEHTAGQGILGLDLWDLAQLPSGAFMAAGVDVSGGSSDAIWLAETDSIGRLLWIRRFTGGVQERQPSLFYSDWDRGVTLAASTQSWFQPTGGAWILKVPRKNGRIDFLASSPAVRSDMTPVEKDSCITTEPYAGGSVTALGAHLVSLAGVEEKDIAVTVERTTP